jgi:hypothetical protein
MVVVSGCGNSTKKEIQQKSILLKGEKIYVELADTDYLRTRGLSYRASLCENCGMLFVFDTYKHYSFWMNEMNFPLDIIYLNGDKISEIFESVPVKTAGKITTVYPENEANKVLELNAGWSKTHNLQIGDNLDILD